MSSDPKTTAMNRRHFLALTAAAAVGAGCRAVENNGSPQGGKARTINAGPVGDYAADGVYSGFRDLGFFIIRKGDKLVALSAFCTHRKCKLTSEPDHSFYCQCHGSTF